MEEKKLTDEATIDSLKEMAIKFSKDTYVNRVLVNAINLIHRLQDEIKYKTECYDELCNMNNEIAMEMSEQKAEIERLNFKGKWTS